MIVIIEIYLTVTIENMWITMSGSKIEHLKCLIPMVKLPFNMIIETDNLFYLTCHATYSKYYVILENEH